MARRLRGIARTILFLGWTLLLVPPYLIFFPLGRWIRRPFVNLWHRGVCAIISLKVHQHGTPLKSQRVLLAGNHISYLDIPVLASCHDITFVAKADVASWPLFGFLARIAQTAFIERKPSQARKQKAELKQRILSGERLMIFPEGTSSNGSSVLPFKTALFEMVMEENIKDACFIQPVSIGISPNNNGKPLTTEQRDRFAWYGDMTLLPHLWSVFCQRSVDVEVIFHAPAKANDFSDRKELAIWAEDQVTSGLHYINCMSSKPLEESQLEDQVLPTTSL
jgi:1-acyl-sn-glycerol-3-phosphate acyltransferase